MALSTEGIERKTRILLAGPWSGDVVWERKIKKA